MVAARAVAGGDVGDDQFASGEDMVDADQRRDWTAIGRPVIA